MAARSRSAPRAPPAPRRPRPRHGGRASAAGRTPRSQSARRAGGRTAARTNGGPPLALRSGSRSGAPARRRHVAAGRGGAAAAPLAARRRRRRRSRRVPGAAGGGGRAGPAGLQPLLVAPGADGAGVLAAADPGAARLLARGLAAARPVPQGQGAGALGPAGAGAALRPAGAGAGGLQQAPAGQGALPHLARPRRAAGRALRRRAEPGRAAAALPEAGQGLAAGQAAAVPRHGGAGGLPAGLRQPGAGHVLALVHRRRQRRRLVPRRALPAPQQPGGDEPGEQRLPVPQAEPALSARTTARCRGKLRGAALPPARLSRESRSACGGGPAGCAPAGTRPGAGDAAGPRPWEGEGGGSLPLPAPFPSARKFPCRRVNGGEVSACWGPGGVLQPAGGRFVLRGVHGTARAQEEPRRAAARAPVLSTAPAGSWRQGPGTVPGAERPSGRLEAAAAPLLPPQPAAFPAPALRGSAGRAGTAPGLLPIVLLAGPESWEQRPSWETLLYPELLFNKVFRQLQHGTASLLPGAGSGPGERGPPEATEGLVFQPRT